MKINALTLITIMAATASATKSFYDLSDDRTCTLGDDNNLTCVKGNDGNAPVIDTSAFQAKESAEPEFQGGGAPADGKRDIAKPYPTCGLGGITGLISDRSNLEGHTFVYLDDYLDNVRNHRMTQQEFDNGIQLIVTAAAAASPLPDPFSREGYAARLALLRKLERQPTMPLPTIRMFLKGAVSALMFQNEGMMRFKDKLHSLRPIIEEIHPAAYSNVKILLMTGMEGNEDLRTRMARLILRIEARRVTLITANIASHIAGDLFTEGVASLRKTAWWMIDDADLLNICRKFAEPVEVPEPGEPAPA
ncbi:uncharacterized protein LOC62_02G003492 [Vanrija pseudolonga]|uniref:Uncharacterized protein n=1 Tax=Vanrija pseudolonga TaxID=143232 RepID=A0AAF1BGM7_9TREE|nr:hypothetical protein LOC62_02G003492 [Vanrija pseudolonga]